MKRNTILVILILILSACNNKTIQVTATGNNNDGTVNIEYKKDGSFHQMFHISVDSLLTFIRNEKIR